VRNEIEKELRREAVRSNLLDEDLARLLSFFEDEPLKGKEVRGTLGTLGEAFAEHLLEKFSFVAIPFDQPKRGFDRVLTAPGYPIIIMESKVNQDGQFHPGKTQVAEQGSSEWIAAHAAKMTDPDSAEWSPANERIAALIRELGPESVPAIAVVIQTETGKVDIYCRAGGAETWQPLQAGTSLIDALSTTLSPGGHGSSDASVPHAQETELPDSMGTAEDVGQGGKNVESEGDNGSTEQGLDNNTPALGGDQDGVE
jgi:hypothetical protein